MYSAKITRANPSAFIILIDQSGSMDESVVFDSNTMPKAEAVALMANMLIGEIVNRSRREEGVRDYFHIAAAGYSDDKVYPAFGGSQYFVSTSQLAGMDVRRARYTRERALPTGENVMMVIEHKFWIEPQSRSNTPMYQALDKAHELARKWCDDPAHSLSYPPIIFNITDGEASDADDTALMQIAEKIKSLATADGNALLINIHIAADSEMPPTLFPATAEELGNAAHARLLYEMSSPMPERYSADIVRLRTPAGRGTFRGMSYNCSPADMLAMIDIGSISINLMQ